MEQQLLRTDNCIEEIMEKYGDMVYRLSIVYLKNSHDADDAYQEVFLRLFNSSPSFESEEHRKAWLITVTANYCKNILRSVWFRRTDALDETFPSPDIPENDVTAEVMKLPLKYRRVLYLHYYEGYSTEEIGEIISQNPATVRTQLKRGRELLKTKILD